MKPHSIAHRSLRAFPWKVAWLGILAISLAGCGPAPKPSSSDDFSRQMNVGKNYLDGGDADKAVEAFGKAVGLQPTHPDARLNLANAYLLAGKSADALIHAGEVLKLNSNEAAAHYISGCAHLRASNFEAAVQALQTAKNLDRTVNATSFQLGRAYQGWGRFEDALREFEEVVQWETTHPAAYYTLSQVLIRLGRTDEANKALETHRQIQTQKPSVTGDISTYEKCVFTQARVPFQLEPPAQKGVPVKFTDATAATLGADASKYRGPIGIIDINHRGANDLFVSETDGSFRLLISSNGTFQAAGEKLPGIPGAALARCLVGDFNNDRFEDVIVVGDKGVSAFRFATNGVALDATAFSNLKGAAGIDGALVDLDFSGKLDLLLVPPGTNGVRVLRNLGNMYFKDITATSGVPASLTTARQLVVDDWNGDDIMDVFVAREGQAPLLLTKQRGGVLTDTNSPADWPRSRAVATGDLNNDLGTDLVLLTDNRLEVRFGGLTNRISVELGTVPMTGIHLVDYDNDGWLDLCGYGDGLRIWRNLGLSGFREVSAELGLAGAVRGRVEDLAAADLDGDCDTDFVMSVAGQGLRLLRNDGGNANKQLKLRLLGNRSNASGIGIRIDAIAGHWRTLRTVARLPVEIGVGAHKQLDAVNVRWFDAVGNAAEVSVEACATLTMLEISLPTGSCPYLYVWDGRRFRFVTDLLGAAPMGLPAREGWYIEADPDEYVWLGQGQAFVPRDGQYVVQITEELREVLYLDEVKLVAVDHPAGTEIYPTDKLLPRKPFPPSDLIALRQPRSLVRAERSDGLDVTGALREADGQMASPVRLRVPQLRGLAEPFHVTLDFGPLPADQPLVLALTGWLRFGGGMANIGASHDPDLPFPFPTLEAETADGQWRAVQIAAGAPAGKTKRIMMDLTGHLPAGCRRLRLSTAFEIHWDQAALFEKADPGLARRTTLAPGTTDLHWRGFSEFEDRPWFQPLTPDYEKVNPNPNWRITPAGWATRYGEVNELVGRRDDALVLVHGGDELTVTFSAKELPEKPAGYVRDFFLFTVGWDKDADFHVAAGATIEPLPFHGMDDQQYGRQARPVIAGDEWIRKYNTRWVGPMTLKRDPARSTPVSRRRDSGGN